METAPLPRPGGRDVPNVVDPQALTGARVTRSTSCCTGRANCSSGDAVVGGRIAAPPITRVAFNEAPGSFSAAGNGHADRKTVITLPVLDPVSA